MHWWQVQFKVTHEAAEAVAALLQEFPDLQGVQLEGIGNVHIPHPEYGEWFDEMIVPTDGVEVSVYFPEGHEPQVVRARVLDVVERVHASGLDVGAKARDIRIDSVDDSTWLNAWKEHYHPIPVGDELVIVPIWNLSDLPEDLASRKPIIVEPGMAFGTGTHQTTHLCTQALAELDLSGANVLDVGTGTGILAIAAARLGASHVTAIDIDPVAVDAAHQNVEHNALSDVITVQEGNLLSGYAQDAKFDVAVANILRDIVILLLPQVARRLNPGGYLLTSGYIDTQAPAVEAALLTEGFQVAKRYQKDDWMAILAVKD
ncbi:50S ribosomal protein L11 methyltransferase [Alicyclobacillus suci]|uniref:50S ribosomal protein L11 methyltransferase n=1 Tax=Alicyclobacillus suci TaxID=2816080 RepID=UPI001A8E3973|nr:50S ribosomal protein L11 methyltransferase [Alicyclobacillus suci]